ncbi:MAG: hypothetical protein IH963_15280, partial [Chloroflexi bacterium]|nr:hypothetical protein [Chloroflexota bacterium]
MGIISTFSAQLAASTNNALDVTIIGFQATAAVATVVAAVAAWRAVKQARESSVAAKEAVLVPLKQEHTREIKDLLDQLSTMVPLGHPQIDPTYPTHATDVFMDELLIPVLDSEELFHDLGNHLTGFKTQWDQMVRLLASCLQQHIDITRGLSQYLTTFFGYEINNDNVDSRELFRHCWATICSVSDRNTDDLVINDMGGGWELFTKRPGHQDFRFGAFSSKSAAETAMNQAKGFPENFEGSDDFRAQMLRLSENCELLQSSRAVVTRAISNVQPIIAFPEECVLLGIR